MTTGYNLELNIKMSFYDRGCVVFLILIFRFVCTVPYPYKLCNKMFCEIGEWTLFLIRFSISKTKYQSVSNLPVHTKFF